MEPIAENLQFDAATHTYTMNGLVVPSVTQVIRAAGLKPLPKVAAEVLARAAARGTAIHEALRLYDEQDLDWDTLDNELLPYVRAWQDFQKDMQVGTLTPNIEKQFCVMEPLPIAGTIDRIGNRLENQRVAEVLIEIKTGDFRVADEIQVAAYWWFGAGARCKHVWVICLNGDAGGSYLIHAVQPEKLLECHRIFLCALELWHFRNAHDLLGEDDEHRID